MTAVSVKELKEILATTKAPRKLCDPVTELPLWDEELMAKVKNAKNKEELKSVDAEIRKCMPPQCDEVYPNIFIGNFKGAKTISLLKENGITHLLNVAEGPGLGSCGVFDKQPYEDAGITYQGFVMSDAVTATDEGQQEKLFRHAGNIIEKSLEKDGNKILVFCFAGMSRSTSSVLTYLILKKKLDLREALKTVKSNRDVLPSAQNLAHLTKMFNADRGLGTVEENVEEYETARYRQLSQGKTF